MPRFGRPQDVTEVVAEPELTVLLVGFVLFAFLIVTPLIVGLVETIALVAGVVAGLVGRVALRRPWRIEALASDGTLRTWSAGGWRASRRQIEQAAVEIERGAFVG